MHPEVRQEKPGRCPKCGMNLVLEKDAGNNNPKQVETNLQGSYAPLFTILGLILLTSFIITVKGAFNPKEFIANFMAGFFLVFSAFKLIDIKGFAQGYSTYDLLAKKVFGYGYIYPFIELAFGLAMIISPSSRQVLILEIAVMAFSGLGVAIKLLKKEKFQCVCLGTFLKVPLTKVTLIEDFGMAALALALLYI